VTLDVARASRVAYERLAAPGHTAIGHVAGPHDVQSARGREEAFLAAAAEHGHGEPPVARGAFTPSGGARAAERLLTRHPELTAVFTSSLAQAIGLLHAARTLGRAVPADLSVIAYDELPVAAYLSPPVTTVAMPLAELGAAAADALVEPLDGGAPNSEVLGSAPELVERASTAPPPPVTIPRRARRTLQPLQPFHPSEENRV
jgi:LacI family transcriptional regulator